LSFASVVMQRGYTALRIASMKSHGRGRFDALTDVWAFGQKEQVSHSSGLGNFEWPLPYISVLIYSFGCTSEASILTPQINN